MVNSNQLNQKIQSVKQHRSLTERFKNYWHIRLAKPGQLELEDWKATEDSHRRTITELNAANDHLQKTNFDVQLAARRYRDALAAFNASDLEMTRALDNGING